MTTKDNGDDLKSVNRALEIVRLLRDRDGATASEVTDELDLGKSAVYNHLTTLYNNEMLVKEGDEYYLSMQFLEYGTYAKKRKKVYETAEPIVERLSEEVGEWANFIIEEHDQAVIVHEATGDHFIALDDVGSRMSLHSVAAGKAILAHLPEERTQGIIDRVGLPSYTPQTITSEQELFEELEAIRDRGYAFNDEEFTQGLRAVAAPVRTAYGGVAGAVSISGPTNRMQGEWFTEEIPSRLLEEASEIELTATYS